MPNTTVLDYNVDMGPGGAWEPRDHRDSGALISWQAAVVRDGSSDGHELYQAAVGGNIFQAETGSDDNGGTIHYRFATKKFGLGAVVEVNSVWLRLAPVTDSVTVTVRAGGSEYGDQERSYTLSFDGTAADQEFHIRCHPALYGRWCQVEVSGDVSARPEVRELEVRYLPVRTGRVSP